MAIAAAAICLSSFAQSLRQTLYFDFGPITGTREGQETIKADENGNYWNNITNNDGNYIKAGTKVSNLVNSDNAATSIGLILTDRFTTNGAGGLKAPSKELLGDFAIESATTDYLFIEKSEDNRTIEFSGLNPALAYRFSIFASRSATQTRTGIYTLTGYNTTKGELQAAGTDIGGSGVNQNNSNILTTDYVFPTEYGTIQLTVSRKTGDYIPINCLKIEEYSNVEKPQIVNYTSVSLSDGTAHPMNKLDDKQFDLWADLSSTSVEFTATTSDGATIAFGMGSDEGSVQQGGNKITVEEGPAYITLDLDALTYSITPVESLAIVGSVTPGGWSLGSSTKMTYTGNMVYNFHGELNGKDTNSDPGRFNFVMNSSWNYTLKRIDRTDKIAFDGTNDINLNPGVYNITADLAEGTFKVENGNENLDPMRITVMGSSVANGQGADPTGEGYAYLYGQELESRYQAGTSDNDFYISNISINGNSTVDLLNRYDELQREFGRYVIYGVSLGNEGIHGAADQQAIYDQFKTNMTTLIANARNDGKYPIVMNNYTRGDFEASDYEMVKSMDEEIERWDCPSVDLLGAIDNGAGRWADGYMAYNSSGEADIYHPNTDGHREFMMAMVPSMMDAIEAGKTLATNRTKNTSMQLSNGATVEFTPEGTTHPFTLSFTFATGATALHLASIEAAGGNLSVDVDTEGLTLTLPDDQTMKIAGNFSDGKTHQVFVSHHYAQGTLEFATGATDKVQLSDIKIAPTKVVIGDSGNNASLTLGELFFYRSGKTGSSDFFNGDKLHKSSLEIYVAFDGNKATQENQAMSLNSVTVKQGSHSGVSSATAKPNLSVKGGKSKLTIKSNTPTRINIANAAGIIIASQDVDGSSEIGNLSAGLYLVNDCKVIVQ